MAVDLTKVTKDLNTNPIIQAEVSKLVLEEIPHISTVMPRMTRLRNLMSNELEMKALSMIPYAGWVESGGLKPLSGIGWDNRSIRVRELAVVVPIKDNVIRDARDSEMGIDIWAEVQKWVIHSGAVLIDQAFLYGAGVNPAWEMDNVYDIAVKAGAVKTSTGDLYQDLMGENGIESIVEVNEYNPNLWVAGRQSKGKLRGVVDATGQPLFRQGVNDGSAWMLDTLPIEFQSAPIWDKTKADFIVGDFSQFVYAIRQDVTFTPFTEGVISDESGKILTNLMQEDSSALRMVMRLAWGCPIKLHDGLNTASRSPFAVLKAA